MTSNTHNILRIFVPVVIVTTAMAGLVHLAVQQSYRQSANDPQIQIAEDLADALNAGHQPGQIATSSQVDISKTLQPFVEFYDAKGGVITGSGVLNGKVPTVPLGALTTASKSGENRITWQPQSNTRIALVIVPFKNSQSSGFVAAGRSIREIEQREQMTFFYVIAAWAITLLVSLAAIAGLMRPM